MNERSLAILLAQEVIAQPDLRWLAPLAREYLKDLGTEDFVTGMPANAALAHDLRTRSVHERGAG